MSRRPRRQAYAGRTRPPSGTMNATEKRYAAHLDGLIAAGRVTAWWYEAMTLKLAHDCRYTPDFVVLLPTGEIVLHEVKGRTRGSTGKETFYAEDDAKVKIKTAGRIWWPFRLVVVWPAADGGWQTHDVEAA